MLEFNDGAAGIYGVFLKLGIQSGKYMDLATKRHNASRISGMARKSSEAGLAQRKKLRTIRKGFCDKEKETEKVESYSAGAF